MLEELEDLLEEEKELEDEELRLDDELTDEDVDTVALELVLGLDAEL